MNIHEHHTDLPIILFTYKFIFVNLHSLYYNKHLFKNYNQKPIVTSSTQNVFNMRDIFSHTVTQSKHPRSCIIDCCSEVEQFCQNPVKRFQIFKTLMGSKCCLKSSMLYIKRGQTKSLPCM